MQTIMNVTYKNGVLIPEHSLGKINDGKNFKIIIFDQNKRLSKKENFFRFVKNHSFDLPPDYKFNREEIYER